MTTLSCINAVKRTDGCRDENDNLMRPPVAPLYMDVSFAGDRSGSMCSTQGGSQTGAVDYIKKQVEASKTLNCLLGFHIDFTTFDDIIEKPYSGAASEVTAGVLDMLRKAMTPRGSTRLYDAILDSLRRQMSRLETKFASLPYEVRCLVKDQPWLFGAACTPMTDGYDNASAHGADQESRVACMNFVHNYSATGMVLAANRDAAELAIELGLDPEAALQMGTTEVECRNAMSSAAAAQLRCATSGGAVPPPATRYFTQLERETSCSRPAMVTPPPSSYRAQTCPNRWGAQSPIPRMRRGDPSPVPVALLRAPVLGQNTVVSNR